jgi:hypothetical protein
MAAGAPDVLTRTCSYPDDFLMVEKWLVTH